MSGSATRAGKAGQLTRLMIHPVDAYGNPGTVSPQDDLRLYINGQDLNVVPSNLSDTHYDFVIKYPKAGVYEVKNAVTVADCTIFLLSFFLVQPGILNRFSIERQWEYPYQYTCLFDLADHLSSWRPELQRHKRYDFPIRSAHLGG